MAENGPSVGCLVQYNALRQPACETAPPGERLWCLCLRGGCERWMEVGGEWREEVDGVRGDTGRCSVPRERAPRCFLKSCSEFLNSALICRFYFSMLCAIWSVIKEHANMISSLICSVASDTCFPRTHAKSPSVGWDQPRGGGGRRWEGEEGLAFM